MITLKTDGKDVKFLTASARIHRETMKKANADSLDAVRRAIQAEAPKETGALSESYEVTESSANRAVLTSDLPYANRQNQRSRFVERAEDRSKQDRERIATKHLEAAMVRAKRESGG